MSGKLLVGLTCPSCGGQITLEEGENLACCKFCGSFFALDAEEGVAKIMYRMVKTAADAQNSVKAWMKSGKMASDLAESAKISEITAAHLPFWRLVGRGKACVCGYTENRDKDGRVTKTPHEALINREYIYSEIACDAGDLGIRTIRISETAEAVSADTSTITAFAATISKDECYKKGYDAICSQAIADGGGAMKEKYISGVKVSYAAYTCFSKKPQHLDKVTFSKAFCIPKGFSLVYYPFYIVRYDYRGRNYIATVDGVTGNIVSGRAPGNTSRQSWFAGVGGAVAGTIAGAGSGLFPKLSSGDSIQLAIFIAIAAYIIAALIIAFSWKQFRDGGEVLTGYAKGRGIIHGQQAAIVEAVPAKAYDYYR
ncbi:MAG TPA: hypothetical protein O0X97_01195 [Methanocorpusculum sp.]|nr:hypothetical protein [Methanocorpusculum sp.]